MNTATATRERPLIFSAPMVRALLAGNKTMTRRVMKPQPLMRHGRVWYWTNATRDLLNEDLGEPPGEFACIAKRFCPYGRIGDRLFPSLPLPHYDGRYCVDTYGVVWSRAKNDWKRLVPGRSSKGYATVTPASGGRYKTQLVHRLVCEAFYGKPPEGMNQVRHLNGDQTDNAPENLDWGSQEQNWQDRAAHGRGMGEQHHGAKLCVEDVAAIRASSDSQRVLSRKYGVVQSTILAARRGETWAPNRKPAPANMPRWASRITLVTESVRAERLADISEEDAKAEGVPRDEEACDHVRHSCASAGCFGKTHKSSFLELWHQLHGDKPAQDWPSNPWVWVRTFSRVEVANA